MVFQLVLVASYLFWICLSQSSLLPPSVFIYAEKVPLIFIFLGWTVPDLSASLNIRCSVEALLVALHTSHLDLASDGLLPS